MTGAQMSWSAAVLMRTAFVLLESSGSTLASSTVYHQCPMGPSRRRPYVPNRKHLQQMSSSDLQPLKQGMSTPSFHVQLNRKDCQKLANIRWRCQHVCGRDSPENVVGSPLYLLSKKVSNHKTQKASQSLCRHRICLYSSLIACPKVDYLQNLGNVRNTGTVRKVDQTRVQEVLRMAIRGNNTLTVNSRRKQPSRYSCEYWVATPRRLGQQRGVHRAPFVCVKQMLS